MLSAKQNIYFSLNQKIYTDTGYCQLSQIKINDKVLTHTGSFKTIHNIKIINEDNNISMCCLTDGRTKILCSENVQLLCVNNPLDTIILHSSIQKEKLPYYFLQANNVLGKAWDKPLIFETNYLKHEWFFVSGFIKTKCMQLITFDIEDEHSCIVNGVVVSTRLDK